MFHGIKPSAALTAAHRPYSQWTAVTARLVGPGKASARPPVSEIQIQPAETRLPIAITPSEDLTETAPVRSRLAIPATTRTRYSIPPNAALRGDASR